MPNEIQKIQEEINKLRFENERSYVKVKFEQGLIDANCRLIDMYNHQISVLEVLGEGKEAADVK